MSITARISVKPLADLICQEHATRSGEESEHSILPQTKKKRKSLPKKTTEADSSLKVTEAHKKAATTSKKAKKVQNDVPSTVKKSKTTKKGLKKDDHQKTIDSYYKSAGKNFHIPPSTEIRSPIKQKPKTKKSRRRITYNDKDKSDNSVSNECKYQNNKPIVVIDLLDSDDELNDKNETKVSRSPQPLAEEPAKETRNSSPLQSKAEVLEGENRNTSSPHSLAKEPAEETRNSSPLQSKAEVPEGENRNTSSPHSSAEEPAKETRNSSPLQSKAEVPEGENRNTSSPHSLAEEPAEETRNSSSSQSKAEIPEGENRNTCSPQPLSENPAENTRNSRSSQSKAKVSEVKNQNTCSPQPIAKKSTILSSPIIHVNKFQTAKETIRSVLQTPPQSTLKRSSEPNCSTLNEASVLSTTDKDDIIVDISDDDFEYAQTKTISVQIKSKNLRKTRSRTKNIEPEAKKIKKSKPTPPAYKIIEGTNGTMAVDAFRFGDIEGVSHYFLTHFHADHYIGLTRKFSHPIYMSSITARLVRAFIPIEEKYIHELTLNTTIKIEDVEVTAIDANHCPGAIMLIFKLCDGRCMLHTGDFRASAEMESEPIFWNNDIHTIYLDTTYISQKYAFCHQSESIERARHLMEEFIEKNVGTRILFVCGAYLIGKEKFWSTLASRFKFKVFTQGNRKKALAALENEELNELLTENPYNAQMHVVPLQKLNYASLLEYLVQYDAYYDLIFALRPSGWEKNSKPQYRGKVNIIGIEYSEHSSYDEMKRFVQYLKPQNVISTVPVGPNAMITAKVPQKWYKYTALRRQYQPSITSFFKMKPAKYFRELTEKYTKILADNSLNKTAEHETDENEPLMVVSPDSAVKPPNDCGAILKPKQEMLAEVPNIAEPIVVDCDADDDWLT